MYVCMHLCMQVCLYVYKHYIYIHKHAYNMHIYMKTYIHGCLHTYIHNTYMRYIIFPGAVSLAGNPRLSRHVMWQSLLGNQPWSGVYSMELFKL